MDYVVLQEIRELQKIDTRNEYFVFVAPGDDRCLEDTQNVHILEIGGDFYPLWEQVTLLKAANELNLDMLHCTSNTAPIRCKIPLILTLHDIIFLEPRDKANKRNVSVSSRSRTSRKTISCRSWIYHKAKSR